MIQVLRDVLTSMKNEGYEVNFAYGMREQVSLGEGFTFLFELPKYRLQPYTKVRQYTMIYSVVQPTEQSSNDVDLLSGKVGFCEILNNLFIDKLVAWQNAQGQQLIEAMGEVSVTPFFDLQVFQYPLCGLYCEISFKVHATTECLWKV